MDALAPLRATRTAAAGARGRASRRAHGGRCVAAARATERVPIAVTGWVDFACPWCYVGHRSLLQAVARAEATMPVSFDFVWRPHFVDDSIAAAGERREAYHGRAFGGESWTYALRARGKSVGARFGDWQWYANTRDAHRLLMWARQRATGEASAALASALFDAAYERGANLSDPGVLLAVAREIPALDAAEAEALLNSQRLSSEVAAESRGFTALPPMESADGAGGGGGGAEGNELPFYVVVAAGADETRAAEALGADMASGGRKGALGLSGAQDVDAWLGAFDRALQLGRA